MPEGLLFRGKYVGKSRNPKTEVKHQLKTVSERNGSMYGNKTLAVPSELVGGETKMISMRTKTASTTDSRKQINAKEYF